MDAFGNSSIDDLDGSIRASQDTTSRNQFDQAFARIDLGGAIAEAKRISASTSDKAYRKLTSHGNVTSYSLLSNLHECPRRFELEKFQANAEAKIDDGSEVNLDFAFGHAVGAGIQTYAATRSVVAAQFAAFTAWKADWDARKLDARGNPTNKSLHHAIHAVEKFSHFYDLMLSDYEVVVLPSGKPAVELAFSVDFQNGFYHFGHIDTVLRHRESGRLAVWEGKTTGLANVDEAAYANSSQALGYSVVVDRIAQLLGATGQEYEVLYVVFSAKELQFQLLPFVKTRTQRAEWLQDILLDHANISTYERLGFYPKRGESCLNKFGRKCYWFGSCGMSNAGLFPGIKIKNLELVDSVEALDFQFTLNELIASQQMKGTTA